MSLRVEMAENPTFLSASIPSSGHRDYHPKAIQIHGRSKFEGTTAHQDDYQQWELPTYEHHGPSEGLRKYIPFSGNSTYADIYKEHTLEPYVPRETQAYKGSNTRFDAASSYAQDFVAKELPRQNPFVPRSKPASGGKFEATTSYHDNYVPHELPEHSSGPQAKYVPRNVPFTATSAYHDEFVPHSIEAQERHEAHQRARPITKFEGTSTAHDDYVAHPLQVTEVVHAPQKALQNRPFEGTTTNHDDYKAWPLRLEQADYKTNSKNPFPTRPFAGVSTMKEDFRGWKLPAIRETLGVATVGDRLHVLIPAQKSLPASAHQTFTTVHNGQTEMCMMIYEGSNPVASRNKLLGQFQLINVPPAPVGVPRVKVTFKLDANNILTVEGHDLDSGRHHTWQKDAGAILAIKYEPSSQYEPPAAVLPSGQAIAVCRDKRAGPEGYCLAI